MVWSYLWFVGILRIELYIYIYIVHGLRVFVHDHAYRWPPLCTFAMATTCAYLRLDQERVEEIQLVSIFSCRFIHHICADGNSCGDNFGLFVNLMACFSSLPVELGNVWLHNLMHALRALINDTSLVSRFSSKFMCIRSLGQICTSLVLNNQPIVCRKCCAKGKIILKKNTKTKLFSLY